MSKSSSIVSRYLDGQARPEEHAQLQKSIASDPEAAREFALEAGIHWALQDVLRSPEQDGAASPEQPASVPLDTPVASSSPFKPRTPRTASWGLFGLAAAALAGVALLWPSSPSGPEVARSADAVWVESGENTPRLSYNTGPVALEAGKARIDFHCGAQVVVEGPARFEVFTDKQIRLTGGRLAALCPTKETHGFTVLVPGGRVVDLGTEFSVEVTSSDASTASVFDGEVQFFADQGSHPVGSASAVLRAGQSARRDHAASPIMLQDAAAESFAALRALFDR